MPEIKKQKEKLKELLKFHYGFESFWPGQEQVIDSVLAEKPTLVIMPTGGGKSLCYQLPALVLDGVTIVISPLIALMKDQVDGLVQIGVPATFINSSLSYQEMQSRITAVKDNIYKLLYIAPERFYNQDFLNALKEAKVSLFAIDEAHCISQWGHDFRPSYLKLRDAIELVGSPPVLALTATATPEVRLDIVKQLDLKEPELVITGFARPNLQFSVIHASENKKPHLVFEALSSLPDEAGIIYVGTRARADRLLQGLLDSNIEAASYHAGMDIGDRKWVQDNFMSGKIKIIVATNAFGLGIDKRNIRYVIHYDMPGTVEAYYQEAGRAGRDGKKSYCLLLYNSRDRALHEFFIKGDNPPPTIIEEIYDILLSYESDLVLITYAELAASLTEKVPEMAVGTSLKLLEREGYIARSHEKSGSAFLKLIKDEKYILDTFGSRAKKQLELFTKLTKRFANELVAGWQLNMEETAEILGCKKEALLRLVRKLASHGLAEYNPPFKGTEIKVLKRVKSSAINIDRTALKEKLKRAYQKLDRIEEYVYDLGCRQKNIMDYFGDMKSRECGQCDICLNRQGIRDSDVPVYDIDQVDAGREAPIKTKLTQLETFELLNQGLSIPEIAQTRELKGDTIINHICFLIEKRLISEIDNFVSAKKQKEIEKATKKVGIEKLKPIYEELGEKVAYHDIKLTLAKINIRK